jgi:hypothetical protein
MNGIPVSFKVMSSRRLKADRNGKGAFIWGMKSRVNLSKSYLKKIFRDQAFALL